METLPPINQKPGSNEGPKVIAKVSGRRGRRETKFLSWNDRQMRKNQEIRDDIPIINKVAISTYRNSFKHNVCVSMLKEGFHKSFDELYNLIEERRKERLIVGVDSPIWLEPSLDDQHEKLEELAKFLTKSESMQRSGKWKDVYECRVRLAEYFLTSGDRWLSDHFFMTALETTRSIRLDGRRREAEAHCNRGLAFERNGAFNEAVTHLQAFQAIAVGQPWKNDDEILLSSIACRHLCRLYTTLAYDSKDVEEQLKLLTQAYTVASDGDELLQKAKCGLNLANKYEETGDSDTAVVYLNECLEIAQDIGDAQVCGEACRAMAISLQALGDITRSRDFFKMYSETARDANLLSDIASASCDLGEIGICQGEYEASVDHCASAYELGSQLGEMVEHPAVLLGIATACTLSPLYHLNIEDPSRNMLERLVLWKDERLNELDTLSGGNETASMHAPDTDESSIDPTLPYHRRDDDSDEYGMTREMSDTTFASLDGDGKMSLDGIESISKGSGSLMTVGSESLTGAAEDGKVSKMSGARQATSALSKITDASEVVTSVSTSFEMPPASSDEVSSEHNPNLIDKPDTIPEEEDEGKEDDDDEKSG